MSERSWLPTVRNLPAEKTNPLEVPAEPVYLPQTEEYDPDEADAKEQGEFPDLDELALRADEAPTGWQMKVLKPKHKQVASLLAQGAKNVEIAHMLGITPEYVSMLSRQPLMQNYIREMCKHTGLRLEALFEKSVDVIASTMVNGTESGKLKAARLQLEATHRIGRGDGPPQGGAGAEDRLLILAQRLLFLQGGRRTPGVYDEDGSKIEDAEFSEPERSRPDELPQESSDGESRW